MKTKIMLVVLAVITFSCCKTSKNVETSNLPLVGTRWNLVAIEDQKLAENLSVQPFIQFNAEGQYSGNLGCNAYFGTYYTKKAKLDLSYTGATKKLCEDMSTEDAFLKAMKKDINNYAISGNTLIMFSGKTEILRFEADTTAHE